MEHIWVKLLIANFMSLNSHEKLNYLSSLADPDDVFRYFSLKILVFELWKLKITVKKRRSY